MIDEFAYDADMNWNLQGKIEMKDNMHLREIRFAEMQVRIEYNDFRNE